MADQPDDHEQSNSGAPIHNEVQVTPTTPVVAARDPAVAGRLLTREEFQGLADIPPEMEWFANLTNANTRRAYKKDVEDFASFVGLSRSPRFCHGFVASRGGTNYVRLDPDLPST